MVLAAPFGAPKVLRIAGGVKLPPLDLRLVWPCEDGHVTVAFLFGASIGPFTRRLMEWVHEEGFCDQATLDKDWIGFAVQVDEGVETVEEFERIKGCLGRFLQTKTKAELLEAVARATAAHRPGHHHRRRGRQPAAARPRRTGRTVSGTVLDAGAVSRATITKASPRRCDPLGPPPRLVRYAATEAVLADACPPLRRSMGSDDARPRRRPSPPPYQLVRPAGPGRAPLAGVKILDFMWAMAGPATTRVLADYGATVVRVESEHKLEVARTLQPFVGGRSGAESSGLFMNMNAGKLGMALDMGNPEARDVILDLVRWADVLCESFSPRAMRRGASTTRRCGRSTRG